MPRHHFLPQFYLKQWFDAASTGPRSTPYFWKISKDGRTRRRAHPSQGDFYITDANTLESSTGERTERVEHLLGRIESVVADTLRESIPSRDPLDRNQVDALNMFFSSMIFRVPSARANLSSGITAMARIERETAEAHGLPEPDTRLSEMNALPHAVYDAMLAVLPELDAMTHRIIRPPAGESFITSDRPALIWAPVGFAGLANRFCEATMPLSPTAMLLITHEGLEASGYADVRAEHVREWNRRTHDHCANWFISNKRSVDWLDGSDDSPPTGT